MLFEQMIYLKLKYFLSVKIYSESKQEIEIFKHLFMLDESW